MNTDERQRWWASSAMQANLVAQLFESGERDIASSRMAGIADALAHASPALPADRPAMTISCSRCCRAWNR
jgi:hypothetical protein